MIFVHFSSNVLIPFLLFSIRSNHQFLIESQSLDGSNRSLITQGRGHCHSISYDWNGNNIYWASSRKIEVFSLANPNITKTLIHAHNAGYDATFT